MSYNPSDEQVVVLLTRLRLPKKRGGKDREWESGIKVI